MTQYVSEEIRTQARNALLQYAIFRPESAVVIALSLVLATLTSQNWIGMPALQNFWWMWLVFGALGEGALIYATMNDKAALRKVINDLFREKFDLQSIRSKELRERVVKALEYRDLIIKEIERKDNFVLDDHLMGVASELEDWIGQVYHLAQTVDGFRRDNIFTRDIAQVPQELDQLRKRLQREKSGRVRDELQQSLEAKERQWNSLQGLQDTMRRAQLKLDNTLSAMGTIYMQTLQLGAQEIDNTRAQRLQADMHEQILSLEDISSAMDEIYSTGARY